MESMRSMVGMANGRRTAKERQPKNSGGVCAKRIADTGSSKNIPVAMRLGETPVLIPNTTVKP